MYINTDRHMFVLDALPQAPAMKRATDDLMQFKVN